MGSTRREFVKTTSDAAAAIAGFAAVPSAARAVAANATAPSSSLGDHDSNNLMLAALDFAHAAETNFTERPTFRRCAAPSRPRSVAATWIGMGAVTTLDYDRYWAQKTDAALLASSRSLATTVGSSTMEEMSAPYPRRHFSGRNGKVTRAVKNLRFNDSPVPHGTSIA